MSSFRLQQDFEFWFQPEFHIKILPGYLLVSPYVTIFFRLGIIESSNNHNS
jgi:hypothetical protein